jgi:hypothetical protein
VTSLSFRPVPAIFTVVENCAKRSIHEVLPALPAYRYTAGMLDMRRCLKRRRKGWNTRMLASDCRSPARPDSVLRRARLAPTLLGVLATFMMQVARADELKPFEISYIWSYGGMTVAVTTLKLERRDTQTWVYSSRSVPRGIGYVFSERPRMESVMRVTDSGVQPLSYRASAGNASTSRDIEVTFDWQQMRVTGVYEGSPMDMPIKPGTQDDLSVQIALMVELLHGRSPETFLLLSKSEVRLHHYTREEAETLDTKIGRVPTIVYRSVGEYSPRATRFWCAPDHGYIPMRVQQKKGDNVEWTMQLESLQRDEH